VVEIEKKMENLVTKKRGGVEESLKGNCKIRSKLSWKWQVSKNGTEVGPLEKKSFRGMDGILKIVYTHLGRA